MISERSCDTEDWSNDAENTALHRRNKLHFKVYSNRKHLFKIVISLEYFSFYCISDAALLSIRRFKNYLKNKYYQPQTFEW